MREILFRGKRKDNGKWVEGSYCQKKTAHYEGREVVEDVKHLIITSMTDCRYLYAEVDPETVCQYTGLADRNGGKIFEGDIVKFHDRNNDYSWMAVIVFGNPNSTYNWGWQLMPIGDCEGNPDILLWVDMEESGVFCEIAGNIFDNSELMNQAGNGETK